MPRSTCWKMLKIFSYFPDFVASNMFGNVHIVVVEFGQFCWFAASIVLENCKNCFKEKLIHLSDGCQFYLCIKLFIILCIGKDCLCIKLMAFFFPIAETIFLLFGTLSHFPTYSGGVYCRRGSNHFCLPIVEIKMPN